ncbi:MAG: DUF1501 domain-containing protein [Pirellulales bacterium]
MTPLPVDLLSRRFFLRDLAAGLGGVALGTLMHDNVFGNGASSIAAGASPRALLPHFAPRAKHVIFLFMAGGPSQLDLFDPKPVLAKYEGQPVPDEVLKGAELPFIERDASLMASPFKFSRHGQSGAVLSELLPHLAGIADDVALVKSVHTDAFNHAPAQLLLSTGHLQLGRPSMGSWIDYGLGSEASDLPAFVVLNSAGGLSGGAACWGNGFLPSVHQGVQFRSQGDAILFVSNPPGHDQRMQREAIDVINQLNREHEQVVRDAEINSRIAAYEMAFRMQSSAPELIDLAQESRQTLDMYGAEPGQSSFANTCLLARRLVERGVRFVSCIHQDWDHHSDVVGNLKRVCAATDRAAAALVADLKQRGLLDETLVIWGGEFGRTPMVEDNPALGRKRGRDHHPDAFTMWFAGGGIKGGQTIGATDDLGYHVTQDPVHIHDVQATILHLLGINHEALTYRYQGRDFRLTDVDGTVVEKLIA